MKKILTFLTVLSIFGGMNLLYPYKAEAQFPPDDPTWQLVFEDDFDSTSINKSFWASGYPWNQRSYLLTCDNNNNNIKDTVYTPNVGYRTHNFENCEFDTTGTGIISLVSKEEPYLGECWDTWAKKVYTMTLDTVLNDTIRFDSLILYDYVLDTIIFDSVFANYDTVTQDSVYYTIIRNPSTSNIPVDTIRIITDTAKKVYPNKTWHNFNYTTAMLWSKYKLRFGYFEIKCKLPYPYVTSQNDGLGPNFWIYKGKDSLVNYSEIDFYEFDGEHGSIPNYMTVNWHFQECHPYDINCNGDTIFHHYAEWWEDKNDYGEVDFGNFRLLSGEWSGKDINYYLDHQLTFHSVNPYAKKMRPMRMIVDINHPTNNYCDTAVSDSTQFPFRYKIDYIRVWQLKQKCDIPVVICNFNASTFDFALYKSISIGGSGCSPVINTGENVTLRATDFILLDKGFTVKQGAEFMADITPCQEQEYFFDKSQAAPPPEGFKKRGKY